MRHAGAVLAVGVEAVDAELDFGEDATSGVQLTGSDGCLYHLRDVVEDPVNGTVKGGIQHLRLVSAEGLQ